MNIAMYFLNHNIFQQIFMSLFIVGSVSRITSKIVHHLAKNSQYKSITIADVLPTYDYHHRFYRLQKQLDEAQSKLQLKLTRPNTINDVKGEGFDDVLYVTHDYYENVISKTKLMQTSALAWRNRKYLYFATPAEYDHFGFANPEANYTQAQKRVFQINPNSTVIRSDILEGTQTFASLKTSNSNFKPKAVKSEEFVRAVCQTIAARAQGKLILIRGNEAVTSFTSDTSDKSIEQSEFKHAKCNISELVSKYSGYTFKGYDGVNQA